MWLPDAVCGELAELLREAINARMLSERRRLAQPGERAWNSAPAFDVLIRLEAASAHDRASANGTRRVTSALLSVDDAARATGVSARAVRERCRTGRLPCARVGRTWIVLDLDGSVSHGRS
jgi:hypothetical protein